MWSGILRLGLFRCLTRISERVNVEHWKGEDTRLCFGDVIGLIDLKSRLNCSVEVGQRRLKMTAIATTVVKSLRLFCPYRTDQ